MSQSRYSIWSPRRGWSRPSSHGAWRSGILVFGEPLSPRPLGIALQITAFVMVCGSALLLPAPLNSTTEGLSESQNRS
ncbi:MAG: hypothetical protein JWO14_2033 [Solirubrobacterales bacterium]|nr:hypothetical protein [Solirubrobacterales bacterium]